MKKLLLTAFLSTIVALTATAAADQHTEAVAEGGYGCCCPWTEFAGLCPVDFLTFFPGFDDVCFVLDDAGNVSGYCIDDPDGVYPFRGLSLPEAAAFISDNYGTEPTVGHMVDFFCGIDRLHAPGGP